MRELDRKGATLHPWVSLRQCLSKARYIYLPRLSTLQRPAAAQCRDLALDCLLADTRAYPAMFVLGNNPDECLFWRGCLILSVKKQNKRFIALE